MNGAWLDALRRQLSALHCPVAAHMIPGKGDTMNAARILSILLLSGGILCGAERQQPLLFQGATISQTHIVFDYAGDLWSISRTGGEAKRLTSGVRATDPVFSPDGTEIAFHSAHESFGDVYIVPAAGGSPRRVTWLPFPARPLAWTPDGRSVLVSSRGLLMVPREGGFAKALSLPTGGGAWFSPDARRVAYAVRRNRSDSWKGYRGGATSPMWIVDLEDLSIEKIPRDNSNDFAPMWVGNRIYFLSDRNGPATLFTYDLTTKRVTELVRNRGWDIQSASACRDAIVYVQGGFLYLYDLNTGRSRQLSVQISGDFPERVPRTVKLADYIESWAGLSPTGDRALLEARGEILTVPSQKGEIRNLTNTPGVREIFPVWSPDGKRIAHFSDESGEYALHVRNEDGTGAVKKIGLGSPPSFFFSPAWSPDSKKIAYSDMRLNLWYVEIDTGRLVRIDTDTYQERLWVRVELPPPSWSPDSRWLAYSKLLKNWSRSIFVYSLETGRTHQLTDGMVDVRFPQFDASGAYLFFASSTDSGLINGEATSGIGRTPSRTVHVVSLRKDMPSPLSQAGLNEERRAALPQSPSPSPQSVRIDLEDLEDRIVALPVPARNYTAAFAGKTGTLYLLESTTKDLSGAPAGRMPSDDSLLLHRFDLASGKVEKLAEGVRSFALSQDGERMLCRLGDGWVIWSASNPIRPGEGKLDLEKLQVRTDPLAEWKQMFNEVWRLERDFFYDPAHHGLDLEAAKQKYRAFLEALATREQLNLLFGVMLSEFRVSHIGAGGGDTRAPGKRSAVGLLGADFELANDRYRLKRVLRRDPWDPSVWAPLVQAGISVKPGDYLLAVDGRELRAADDFYRLFDGKVNSPVTIRVSTDPTGADAREMKVVPFNAYGDNSLRRFASIEENRLKVDRLTGGRAAYISLADTSGAGHSGFVRQLAAQQDKQAVILDLRETGGGRLGDSFVQGLSPLVLSFVRTREGEDIAIPLGTITGPKVMLVDESCFSGAEALAYFFRRAGLGLLVGTRTAGGLVGVGAYLTLMDGGWLTAPQNAIFSPDGKWVAEGEGIAPDIEVEQDPALVRSGRDPQLEKAVEVVLEALRKNPPPGIKRPPYKRLQ